jgi:cell division protein FtsI (penicillin-binding protein 3)
VFQRIAEASLRHLGVPPTLNAPAPVLVTRRSDRPEFHAARSEPEASIVQVGANGDVRDLPDLRGLSAREALRILTKIGLTARLTGSGVVTAQLPAPGTPIDRGMACELKLERDALSVAAMADDQ